MPENPSSALQLRRVWAVGALCRAVADALEARFNPVAVRGEISGFSRAASGHCYFTLKDGQGQLRCAMFRRAASMAAFAPRDGDQVEVRGRLDVYDARGELQLVVESLARAGQGSLFEQFMRLREQLQADGLFDPARKRAVPRLPRGVGLVTSAGAAALHDVATALRRRAPHLPVLFAPAAVQGAQAPAELCEALEALYVRALSGDVDVILLVRGGGSLEDLWAFNDERLARTIVRSPVPVVVGVGHETDFTIADFCADLRAPTPTAAAELVAHPRDAWLEQLAALEERLGRSSQRRLEAAHQRLDVAAGRLGRPLGRIAQQQQQLERAAHRLRWAADQRLQRASQVLERAESRRIACMQTQLGRRRDAVERCALRLGLLDPRLVLERGYALLTRSDGSVLARAAQAVAGETLAAQLADGRVDVVVTGSRPD
ncbi:exodeoxyribonuclease VII large subunit [Ramlibacter rhizophilus]|uniref:Exodeoxyribonuclease 7 large subunit n=1 Tax=Ramlibacter rhizophilus TaxID=1781167 RepID=A0A4Z0C2S2_9BURK|nr:exodeoxyribonuclease VII large subunit [Ramlibacter rhizophilus]TFZ04770.1 exodeoxyribonuclease VII large subunit [Ramlibacter rhizophilus]